MPRLLSQGLEHGLAKRDAGVFDGVMLIDVEIAFGVRVQIERAVARDEVEHMVEKADSGGDLRGASAVEIQTDVGYPSRWFCDESLRFLALFGL